MTVSELRRALEGLRDDMEVVSNDSGGWLERYYSTEFYGGPIVALLKPRPDRPSMLTCGRMVDGKFIDWTTDDGAKEYLIA